MINKRKISGGFLLGTGLAAAAALCAAPALAAPRGGMGGGMGAGMGGGMMTRSMPGMGSPSTMSHSSIGGQSSTHMSSQGTANTNGPTATDRDAGLDRAEDRASAQGLANGTALQNNAGDSDEDDLAKKSTARKSGRDADDTAGSGTASTDAPRR